VSSQGRGNNSRVKIEPHLPQLQPRERRRNYEQCPALPRRIVNPDLAETVRINTKCISSKKKKEGRARYKQREGIEGC